MELFIYKCRNSMLFIFISYLLFGDGLENTTFAENGNVTITEPGVCGPIASKLSEEEACYIGEMKVICPKSSQPGTVLRRKCRRPYKSLDTLLYGCYKGHWTPRYDNCWPSCGTPTKNNEHPWLVAIYDSNDDLVCAGTIISPFHVVTARTCFKNTFEEGEYKVEHPENYQIIAGKHYSNIHKKGGSFQKRKIKNSAVYNSNQSINIVQTYVMLLEVDREFGFSEKDEVRPICLDWLSFYEELELKDGNQGYSVGWEYDGDQVVPCNLQNRYNVQYWQRHTCSSYVHDLEAYVPQLVCTEHINAGGISGNCGKGPGSGLFFKSIGGKYILRGILYWNGALSDRKYQFYIKIALYYDWLKVEMKKNPRIPRHFGIMGRLWQDHSGCILPKNIKNGNFTSTLGSPYVEGKRVPSTTTLLLSCAETTNASMFVFWCKENMWTPPINSMACRQPGTCPSILTTTSERVDCKLNGAIINCTNPPHNTTALVRCQPFYTKPANSPISKCQDGEWDQPFVPCTLECGLKRVGVTELIIGGQQAIEHEYPWVVGVYNFTDHICGGTIISRKFVLSAAHCFTDIRGDMIDQRRFSIVAGKHYKDIEREESSMQKRKIKKLNIYPDYRGSYHKYRDDIALIEVDEDFMPSMEVEPVCVDWDNTYDDFDLRDDNLGVITGWGFTSAGGTPSDTLKKLVVPFRDKRVCVDKLPSEFSQQFVVQDKICAGYEGNNSNVCRGDSGGGLYFNSDGKLFFIRGITSITVRSEVGCDPNQFALYTKVSMYLPWLESITRRIY